MYRALYGEETLYRQYTVQLEFSRVWGGRMPLRPEAEATGESSRGFLNLFSINLNMLLLHQSRL